MNKFIPITLILIMLVSLAAGCGSTQSPATEPTTAAPASALEILENIWGKYGEGEAFPIIGGNIENAVDNAPGNYDLTYAENLTYNLLVPVDQIANVEQVASMIHGMNANSFTCGAFRLAEGVAAADFAAAMQSAVQGNMWMCGFPERLVIASLPGEYVVMAFGVNDAMTPFVTHLGEAYPEAVTLYDEPIA